VDCFDGLDSGCGEHCDLYWVGVEDEGPFSPLGKAWEEL
jgi:hypothetical protein